MAQRHIWDLEQVRRNSRYLVLRGATGGSLAHAEAKLAELSAVVGQPGRLTQEEYAEQVVAGQREARAIAGKYTEADAPVYVHPRQGAHDEGIWQAYANRVSGKQLS
jgi:hypothetical protein